MNGILPLWKPRGMTSHDCVIQIRNIFKTKKVGHTGTLDPEVEGVLSICIGEATKIVPYLTETKKGYVAQVTLGQSTDTEDRHGATIDEKSVTDFPSKKKVENVLQSFRGTIKQVPPMYSAVKVNGKKLYEYARAGEEIKRPVREVTIHELNQLPLKAKEEEKNRFSMEVVCSKGTYIRTLCVDIGKQLGYPAHMSDLIRTKSASFTKKDTVTFAMIEEAVKHNQQDYFLLPMIKGLDHLDILYVDEETKRKVHHGQKILRPEKPMNTDPFEIGRAHV